MAAYNNIQNETYIAGADLSAKQFTFVKLNASGEVISTVDGEAAVGVLWNAPLENAAASVVYAGSPMVYAGGTIAAGAAIASDLNGKVITAATSDIILGWAREAAVANQLVKIDFIRGGNASA